MKRALGLVLVAAATAAAQPRDVAGWANTRWGMTAPQLRKLYPQAKTEKREGLLLEDSDAAGVRCAVFLKFGDDDKLASVILTPKEMTRQSTEGLIKGLSEKYGRPTSREEYVRTWTFTSTSISLSFFFLEGKKTGLVLLTYQRPEATQPGL